MFYFISLYMQQVLGYSAIHAGLSYLPLALVIMASAGIASQLVTKLGYKPVLAAGLLFIVVGLLWFSRVSVGGGFITDILGPSLLAAAGLGFAFVTTTIAAVSGVEERRGGPRQRPDQHLPADRRRARPRGPLRRSPPRAPPTCRRAPGSKRASPRASRPPSSAAPRSPLLGFVLTLVLIRSSDSRAHVELGKAEAAGRPHNRPLQ